MIFNQLSLCFKDLIRIPEVKLPVYWILSFIKGKVRAFLMHIGTMNKFIWILNFMKINYDNIVLISISLLSIFIFLNLKKSKKKKVLKQIKKFI